MTERAALSLEIVTPKGVVLRADIDEVVAPGVRGEFGLMPGHVPMLAALHVGVVHYRTKNAAEMIDVAVGGGFVEMADDTALILTDRFITKDAIEVLVVRERLRAVDDELDKWLGELDSPKRLELIEEEQWLAAQLEVYGDPPVAHVLEQRRPHDFAAVLPSIDAEPAHHEGADDSHGRGDAAGLGDSAAPGDEPADESKQGAA
ncbi:MAG: ATP synthase F1 subunit epsilon [Myxococcales bacterium]|nr:ATP synthase F1 subunit epsilon [Myxococcales bacterium]